MPGKKVKKKTRKKGYGMASFLVPGVAALILFAAVISFNANKISDFLINNQYGIENILKKAINDAGRTYTAEDNSRAYDGPYTVNRVVDGDTFVVTIEDIDMKIRLIGIEAPEYVTAADDNENNTKGKIAADYLKNLLADRKVYLEYDVSRTDKYGRLLAYAYYEEGGQMIFVNQKLLADGMAQFINSQPYMKYAELLKKAEDYAKKAGAGIWKDPAN